MLPRRASPAAIVVDRGQCCKVSCAAGDKTTRKEDWRPRTMGRSFQGCRWDIPPATGTRLQRQEKLDMFS
jgi:hypothetical protein